MEVAMCGRRGRETEPAVWKKSQEASQGCGWWCPRLLEKEGSHASVPSRLSGDPSTSHFGGVLVVAESRLQGGGKEMGGKQQRQKTQYSFYKFGRKDKDKLGF